MSKLAQLVVKGFDLRFRIMHDHSFVVSARKDFRAVIVEAQTKDIAIVLIFHDLWLTDAGHCLFQFPKQYTPIVSTLEPITINEFIDVKINIQASFHLR